MRFLYLSLSPYEKSAVSASHDGKERALLPRAAREFHVRREVREAYGLEHTRIPESGFGVRPGARYVLAAILNPELLP